MSMEATLATWELKKSQVNSREKFFLLCLARRAGEDHTCWPSIARMVDDTGFDRKTLIDVRQALIARQFVSYTGRMVGRSGQIPEMRLEYVQKWEETRNSPRLNDEKESVDKSTVVNLTSPKNGMGTSTGNGTGTSPKNGTLNSSLENKNRNKSFCVSHEQKKHKAVDKREDWKEANQKKHSWAEKGKEPPTADVTRQSTSYDPAKHNDTKRFDPNSPGYQAFLSANPAIKRAHERRKKIQTTELSTGTAVQSEIPSRSEPDEQGASIDAGGCKDNSPPLRGNNGLLEARRVHSFLEETGMAG